jgi:hypothetical protein
MKNIRYLKIERCEKRNAVKIAYNESLVLPNGTTVDKTIN